MAHDVGEEILNSHKVEPEISFADARKVIIDAFKDHSEGEIRHTYLANIAMLLYDRYDVPLSLANQQADDILNLCFDKY